MKRFLAIVAALLVVGSLSAQNKAALTIVCNQSGAQVLVAGRLVGTTTPNVSVLLPAGTYSLMVTKQGFQPFNTTITLPGSGLTLNVNLTAYGAVTPTPPPPPAPASKYALTINSPAPNTQVLINGALQGNAPLTIQVVPGTYNITTRTPGRMEWNQQVQVVNGPVTVNPGSQPMSYQVQVNAGNTQGAVIILNGSQVGTGSYSANLPGGTYTVVIRAPGFNDYTETFTLNGPKSIFANLQQQAFQLQVRVSNAQGAQIFLNGSQVGSGSYNANLPGGTYTLLIRAGGFTDYTETFNLGAPKTVSVALQQSLVTFTVSIPANFLNANAGPIQGRQNDGAGKSEGKGNDQGKGREQAPFEVYVDGQQIQPSGPNTWSGAVAPGNHSFKILAGSLKFETTVNLQPGKNWLLQPTLGISVQ